MVFELAWVCIGTSHIELHASNASKPLHILTVLLSVRFIHVLKPEVGICQKADIVN